MYTVGYLEAEISETKHTRLVYLLKPLKNIKRLRQGQYLQRGNKGTVKVP